jgi:hypothetical protein
VNKASEMDTTTAADLKVLLSNRDFNGFRDACPLANSLDGFASECVRSVLLRSFNVIAMVFEDCLS